MYTIYYFFTFKYITVKNLISKKLYSIIIIYKMDMSKLDALKTKLVEAQKRYDEQCAKLQARIDALNGASNEIDVLLGDEIQGDLHIERVDEVSDAEVQTEAEPEPKKKVQAKKKPVSITKDIQQSGDKLGEIAEEIMSSK
jgi:hypothetical protein